MWFEWDYEKARSNLAKHGVSFEEAITAFADPLSLTVFDPDHSDDEDRFVLLGATNAGRLVVVVPGAPASSVLDSRLAASGETMATSRRREADGMRREYDFSNGVRGKYAERFVTIVLDPDVAAVFKTSKAVNDALRSQLSQRAPARRRRTTGR